MWNFDFKTHIDRGAVLIEYVRVAVNVQEGYFINGSKASVDYKPDFFLGPYMEGAAAEKIIGPEYVRAASEI
ncbi:MAG: hypothetical protein NC907_01260 [Candidatus Omnitrophica bacterium]|nr:hypothetical protein [Candidatus Omnitrophota bacterium]